MVAVAFALALAAPTAAKETTDFDLGRVAAEAKTPSPTAKRRKQHDHPPGSANFPAADEWVPPAKSWGQAGRGLVFELGALGARQAWQPNIAHVSLQWHF